MLTRTPIESHLNVDDLLEQLTLEEKAALTAGMLNILVLDQLNKT